MAYISNEINLTNECCAMSSSEFSMISNNYECGYECENPVMNFEEKFTLSHSFEDTFDDHYWCPCQNGPTLCQEFRGEHRRRSVRQIPRWHLFWRAIKNINQS
ncbi:hypothetical protein SK128_027438 [Halocaridina rubra]|uniref:Uncharacterized protein n=1 Tax=Halocaridina rubra TaxID=373956 RepID=A0AAN9A780_HALRR